MEIAKILLVVLCIFVMWLVLYIRSDICPSCNKRINKRKMRAHLIKCVGITWYSLPIVSVSHLSALEVEMTASKTWGVWDTVTEDWVKDFNNIVDDRVLKNNAIKLLKLIKAKSIFSEMVDK